ncbi:MAG: metallophosphoesterase, partial [Ignavibacteria bacterium]
MKRSLSNLPAIFFVGSKSPSLIFIYFAVFTSSLLICTSIVFAHTPISVMSDDDSSSFGADGPIIIHNENGMLCYSIVPETNGFKTILRSVTKDETFTCNIGASGRTFSFKLKKSIVNEPDNYPLPPKMLIISDIEGNFEGFESILTGAGVVDSQLNWTFGNGHLILPGDFFDRGLNVTECLWLIYKLETEAAQAGGKVHFILGNHEVMNMRGDFRYVRKKYLANADSLGLDYKNLYSSESELGRWLRSKNCIERIGNYIFVHGGISPQLQATNMNVGEINGHLRLIMDKPFDSTSTYADSLILRKNGPLWYRGIAMSELTSDSLNGILQHFDAEKIIIGHTVFDEITNLYDGRVIAIDLDHAENHRKGFMKTLWFEKSRFSVINNKGSLT